MALETMVIARSPLRVTLGGGGTDLPAYYRVYGGCLVAAAINRYVFVSVSRPFVKGIHLKYSVIEKVDRVENVQHPIIREALRLLNLRTPQIEIVTVADIPAGTGLGSSGSFTTALLKALWVHRREILHPSALASLACDIEINKLGEPIGKQDQYIAAFGGVTCFDFNPDESVCARPLRVAAERLHTLEDHLTLFFTGSSRRTSQILKDQHVKLGEGDSKMLANLHEVKELGLRSRRALEAGRLAEFGGLLHDQWEQKKARSNGMSDSRIDEYYDLGRRNGALGGKVVGAGGGGFLLFYTEQRTRLREAMHKAGLEEVRFRFDFEGTKVLFS